MTADELLERASSRLLTEYELLFQIKAEDRVPRRIEADEPPNRLEDQESDDEDVMDERPEEDLDALIAEQTALLARLTSCKE